jgi:ABC-type sulfate transport system permease subunit
MKQKLPNATAVLILGIASIPTCFCWGIAGLIMGIIALVLAGGDQKKYDREPELYENYSHLKIGRIFAVIGMVLSTIFLIFTIFIMSMSDEERRSFEENLRVKAEQQEQGY